MFTFYIGHNPTIASCLYVLIVAICGINLRTTALRNRSNFSNFVGVGKAQHSTSSLGESSRTRQSRVTGTRMAFLMF